MIELNSGTVPPGGWRYVQRESGYEIVALDLVTLRCMVREHREGNGYDLEEGWWDTVKVEMCADLPEGFCREEGPREGGMGMRDLVRFFRAIRQWLFVSGRPLRKVSIEEAKRRADVCRGCPLNQEVPSCPLCRSLLRWVGSLLDDEEQAVGADLKSCAACKCVLAVKVFIPDDVIDRAENGGVGYPSHCWRRK